MQQTGALSDTFGSKDIGPLFIISMQTRVDEMNSEKHFKMGLTEFVEALARVADKCESDELLHVKL